MNTRSTAELERIEERFGHLVNRSFWQNWRIPITAGIIVAYVIFCCWFFAFARVISTANWGIAGNYLADWISYEIRPELKIDADGAITIGYSRFDPAGPNPKPDWLVTRSAEIVRKPVAAPTAPDIAPGTPAPSGFNFMAGPSKQSPGSAQSAPPVLQSETAVVTADIMLGRSARLQVDADQVTLVRGDETVTLRLDHANDTVNAGAALPEWVEQRQPGARAFAFFGFAGWAEISADRVRVHNRFLGWANFLFDTNSGFFGKSTGEVLSLITSGERIEPDRSNLSLAWNDILYNPSWQHLDVWSKLLQTIVMAFVGTVFATVLSFPLSFIAARNITRNRPLNQLTKRFFDFLRSVDMLIWALFFTRAFGPGPLAGISAIFLTDTGTLGKLYAEALENIDDKQREGVKSVGAPSLAVQRFGVVPQVLPVFASQALYFWESNTRSATIIGAVGAGGIGLKLWEAMRTNSNWENVCYMVLLILMVVFIFDAISNALRSRLIGKRQH